MEFIELLLIGTFTAFIGSSIPGLLNMTVVKIGKAEGKKSVYTFMGGIALTISIQVYLAIFLAKFIDFNDHVTAVFRKIGLVVFILITIYFLFFAQKNDAKKKSKKSDTNVKQKNKFIYGVILAALNVFPIPFYVFLSAILKSHNINVFGQPNSSIFTLGVVLGTMLIFILYLKYFSSKSEENSFILKNINYVIGGITSVISLLTIYELIK